MVHHGDENVLTTTFTPRDYQVELFEAAKEHNIIVCLGTGSGKTFIAAMLIREKAHEVAKQISRGGKRTVFLANTVPLVKQQAAYLTNHTPLRVKAYTGEMGVDLWKKDRWLGEFEEYQVLVMTTQIFADVLHFQYYNMRQVNVLVLDECHHAIKDSPMRQVLSFMDQCNSMDSPRVLGLTASLINASCKPIQLSRKIEQLETTLRARAQTAADIVGMLCYSTQPKEMIVECASEIPMLDQAMNLEKEILNMTGQLISFMENHRFNPIELYGDEEYCRNIPDPTKEPLEVLKEFEFLVNAFGVWGADRAALVFLIHLEKLKTRTAYERHYLLLCLVFTLMLQVRAKCDEAFQSVSEPDRIMQFTKPKVLRFLSILQKYQPVQLVNLPPKDLPPKDVPMEENQDSDAKMEDQVEEKAVVLPTRSGYLTRRKRDHFVQRYSRHTVDVNALCGLIFVERRSTAKLLYHLLKDASRYIPDLAFLNPLYIVGRQGNPLSDSKEVELETKKQEEVLKRFRTGECNVLVSTSVLEEGIDVPICHLVVRYDLPKTYRAYVQSRGRARAKLAHYILMVDDVNIGLFLDKLAQFHAIEQLLLKKCHSKEPPNEEHQIADELADVIAPYMPVGVDGPRVTLLNAVGLTNRYCAKLPSDSFTRLVPNWTMDKIPKNDLDEETLLFINKIQRALRRPVASTESLEYVYKCSLFLPINSPLRGEITGYVMPSKVLAKRSVALETCKRLHAIKELDDHLLPVGKENMNIEGEEDEEFEDENVSEGSARPGTTKRRQYYYKQVAECFNTCQPQPGQPAYLYALKMELTEPIPEEQNTRGRKIFRPELSTQSFGIVTSKPIPTICSFPIFTRSGEVEVTLVEIQRQMIVDQALLTDMKHFQRYVFQNVLMLEKNPMVFNVGSSPCSYLVVPLKQNAKGYLSLDREFVEKIALQRNHKPRFLKDQERKSFEFTPESYQDTVVMRWYREQEHPQCFYVAETCWNLNPQSKFPDHKYNTFEEYYKDKYGIQIQDLKQPLLDVDHSSSRLNFLTPRYMNRKGMILPTSSEETKRAKRESLQQKQILVPELCCIHPFTASLWRQAVCLPCVLYRLNGLLISESLRLLVAKEIGLGKVELPEAFEWEALRFGWKKKAALLKSDALSLVAVANKTPLPVRAPLAITANNLPDPKPKPVVTLPARKESVPREKGSSSKRKDGYAIGVWSPDTETMKDGSSTPANDEEVYDMRDLQNVTMLGLGGTSEAILSNGWGEPIRETNGSVEESSFKAGSPDYLRGFDDYYGSNTNKAPSEYYGSDSEGDSYTDDEDNTVNDEDDDEEDGEDNDEGEENKSREFGPKLVFKGDTAEAVEDKPVKQRVLEEMVDHVSDGDDEDLSYDWDDDLFKVRPADVDKYHQLLQAHKKQLRDQIIAADQNVEITRGVVSLSTTTPTKGKPTDKFLSALNSDTQRHQLASASQYTAQLTEFLMKPSTSSPSSSKVGLSAENRIDVFQPGSTTSKMVRCEQNWVEEHLNGNGDMVSMETVNSDDPRSKFSFDEQPDLATHPGPNPSVLLQAFTMSNANDGINLERLETIGDSFLKYAITTYLYCQHTSIHEGKLSHLRSKKVSNLHLYRLGKKKCLGEWMIASKFNPHDNWLPPGYVIPRNLEEALIESGVHASFWNVADFEGLQDLSAEEVRPYVMKIAEKIKSRFPEIDALVAAAASSPLNNTTDAVVPMETNCNAYDEDDDHAQRFVPYNLLTQHSVPDKSIADCAEALIGAYLTACGPRGALLFMSWLGIRVLPLKEAKEGVFYKGMDVYGTWKPPVSPIIARLPNSDAMLVQLLTNFDVFEERIQYRFKERSYLLQAFTHASYYPNRLTDCYQRLEFLGDAVLDYLITRYLYEDPRQHPPGALTDLRSALVNNTTFAVLAVRYGFHNYFKHFSHALDAVLDNFIKKQEENGHQINDEYFIEEDESEGAEDVEVPKALGDVFESVAGAIYLDSGLSLDAVWKVYYRIMRKEIEEFSKNVPKSPIRELLELENDRVKFGKAEKIPDGRVRVTVEVIGKGTFKGIGRNYRIAKCTAAKYALRTLDKHKLLAKRSES